ncbi:hypothetical protein [Streptomyces sp. NPDC101455]|uniref:hypothetical protein n=1 Tax=Streptomyces sp. NPDC101455 TaxID=3366142 RepID=UPI0038218A67
MTGAAHLGQAHADSPHQLRTELARQARDRAAASRTSIALRLRRGQAQQLAGVRRSTIVTLFQVHARLLLIGGA